MMFVGLRNEPRPYAWGSRTGISDLLGTVPSGNPEAEVWFGTHPACPSLLEQAVDGFADLASLLQARHSECGLTHESLSFLLKVLAAGAPLSLQVHPSPEEASAGFARENALGIPLDSPLRNYHDDQAKPEMIVAVTQTFVGLSGFRPLTLTLSALRELLAIAASSSEALAAAGRLEPFLDWLELQALSGSSSALRELVTRMLSGKRSEGRHFWDSAVADFGAVVESALGNHDLTALSAVARDICETVATLRSEYEDDPGVVIGAFLNRVELARGEALYLPSGNMHAYLSGVGIELMRASDNVLRGGLTVKHVDVMELIAVTDFSELDHPRLEPTSHTENATVFTPWGAGFSLVHVCGSAEAKTHIEQGEGSILLCVAGALEVSSVNNSITVHRGQAVFVSPDEGPLTIRGDGEAFFATTSA